MEATVQAGITLWDLNRKLWEVYGLALPNLGNVTGSLRDLDFVKLQDKQFPELCQQELMGNHNHIHVLVKW